MTSLALDLQLANRHAQAAKFAEMLAVCQQIIDDHGQSITALLDVGALLSSFGFLTPASECFERARAVATDDLRPVVNLANLARDRGDHAKARSLYLSLLEHLPNQPIIQRNAVVSLEYDPDASDPDRLAAASAWSDWAIVQAGGIQPRPVTHSSSGRPLRIGYVSPDMCQHTVGLFVKDVLRAHHPERVRIFAYSSGQVKDWVTEGIAACCQLRDVAGLDDTALADLIRADCVDVLVDLSGHTGGSRLIAFAHRPAPVQVSWLGYFATTGLPYIDRHFPFERPIRP